MLESFGVALGLGGMLAYIGISLLFCHVIVYSLYYFEVQEISMTINDLYGCFLKITTDMAIFVYGCITILLYLKYVLTYLLDIINLIWSENEEKKEVFLFIIFCFAGFLLFPLGV
jgi:hypothetical protein